MLVMVAGGESVGDGGRGEMLVMVAGGEMLVMVAGGRCW